MPDLLLEILSEEIPARMQSRAADDLKRLLCDGLTGAGLAYTGASAYVTPRRLALVVEGLPERQPDVDEEKKGPKVGAPEQAIEGFLKANGLASVDQAEVRETDKGAVYFAVRHVTGLPTAEVLPGLLIDSVRSCPWPKSMRWTGSFRWVRPLHGILAVFAGEVLPGALDLGGGRRVPFGDTTHGHRFLAPEPLRVTDFADYEAKLRKAKVILDREERKAIVADEATRLAKAKKLVLKDDPALLDELAGLVEWPQVLLGRIDGAYMNLPPEVLTTTMRSHQKYLALLDRDGRLADRFALVANLPARKGSKRADNIVAGNERVLRARLADARFFWDQDRRRNLASRVPDLSKVVFHAKLGSMEDKALRIATLAAELSVYIDGCDSESARHAAKLAKADLTTGMVGEFPELQGVMGRYYALAEERPPAVADAIALHYLPQGASDCPTIDVAPVAVAVGLADRIDTLVGFWAIGEVPTSSKDPYALRRAALGVVRLILENELRIPLVKVFERTFELYLTESDKTALLLSKKRKLENNAELLIVRRPFKIQDHEYDEAILCKSNSFRTHGPSEGIFEEDILSHFRHHRIIIAELLDFFADRLKIALRDTGVRHDLIAAVFAVTKKEQVRDDGVLGEVDLVRVLARVRALEDFLHTDDGENLLVAYRRAANIVRDEEKKDKLTYAGWPNPNLLKQSEEKTLHKRLEELTNQFEEFLQVDDFVQAMSYLAQLRSPIDSFFDHVTVNCNDDKLRDNRLQLLSKIRWTMDHIADFSCIEG